VLQSSTMSAIGSIGVLLLSVAYYVLIQISNARTGKVLNQGAVNFAGSDDGWASGVAWLIRRRVLAGQNQP
jgi:hypothetical protein